MRIDIKQAKILGLIDKAKEFELKKELRAAKERRELLISKACNKAGVMVPSVDEGTPQYEIFMELNRRISDVAMYEVGGLVPGRKYRADIYLPESRLVIEMDGYQFHSSKDKFQSDREKRAKLVMLGYPVFAVYYAQVKNHLSKLVDDILIAHEFYKPFASQFFERQLAMAVEQNPLISQ